MFITSLHHLNPGEGVFSADFWLWFDYPPGDIDPLASAELINAKSVRSIIDNTETVDGAAWGAKKITATFLHDWDVKNFPFDQHELTIVIEDALKQTNAIQYVADIDNSAISDAVAVSGWKIRGFSIETSEQVYDSTFGDPRGGARSVYPRATVRLTIQRAAMGVFFKLHIALYVAFAITLLSFFMSCSKDDIFNGRIGLMVGMLFAAILNRQVVDATIGQTIDLSLSDRIHSATFVFIFVAIAMSLWTRRLCERGRVAASHRFDRVCLVSYLAIYLIINLAIVLTARA